MNLDQDIDIFNYVRSISTHILHHFFKMLSLSMYIYVNGKISITNLEFF